MDKICIISVGVAALLHFLLGHAWFGKLFGKAWMASLGKTEQDFDQSKSMKKALAISFVCSALIAVSTIHFILLSKTTTLMAALCAILCPVIGFVLAPMAMMIEFENKKWSYLLISGGYIVAGVVIAVIVNSLIAPYTVGAMK